MRNSPSNKRRKVTPENAIPDYKQYLAYSDDPDRFEKASRQLAAIIEDRVRESFGDMKYNQAIEEMGVFREQAIDLEEPAFYNEWIRAFKKKLVAGRLGGERGDFWRKVKSARLGLAFEEEEEEEEEEEDVKTAMRGSKDDQDRMRKDFEEEAKSFWNLD
jgi:ATP-dependent DNA helicase 2 subunit 2